MKSSFSWIAFLAFLIACIILNVFLFLTLPKFAPEGRISEPAFWITWTVTFPVNIFIWFCGLAYLAVKKTDFIIDYPIVLFVLGAGFAAHIYVAFKFLFYSKQLTTTRAIIVETVMTGVYLILILGAFLVLKYMNGNQGRTKEKVLFIRLLKADIDACIPLVNDPELKTLLGKLSEKVRFSDPMSHDSLGNYESEISRIVMNIQANARAGIEKDIADDIKRADALLDCRNERCKILK